MSATSINAAPSARHEEMAPAHAAQSTPVPAILPEHLQLHERLAAAETAMGAGDLGHTLLTMGTRHAAEAQEVAKARADLHAAYYASYLRQHADSPTTALRMQDGRVLRLPIPEQRPARNLPHAVLRRIGAVVTSVIFSEHLMGADLRGAFPARRAYMRYMGRVASAHAQFVSDRAGRLDAERREVAAAQASVAAQTPAVSRLTARQRLARHKASVGAVLRNPLKAAGRVIDGMDNKPSGYAE